MAEIVDMESARQSSRPISSAPRDGTEILIWVTGAAGGWKVGSWDGKSLFGPYDQWRTQGDYTFEDNPSLVSYWMPLPVPPERQE